MAPHHKNGEIGSAWSLDVHPPACICFVKKSLGTYKGPTARLQPLSKLLEMAMERARGWIAPLLRDQSDHETGLVPGGSATSRSCSRHMPSYRYIQLIIGDMDGCAVAKYGLKNPKWDANAFTK